MKKFIALFLAMTVLACARTKQDISASYLWHKNLRWESCLGDEDKETITYLKDVLRNTRDNENYYRGRDALLEGKNEEAKKYFRVELKHNPGNGYAALLLAAIYEMQDDCRRALPTVNWAIEAIPEQDKVYKSQAYSLRAQIYAKACEYEKALSDLVLAEKADSNNVGVYVKRADIYYDMKEYGLANQNYQKVLSMDSGSVAGHLGIGRIANKEARYKDALQQFNYADSLFPNYIPVYLDRLESYVGLKKYDEAVDGILYALENFFDTTVLWCSEIESMCAENFLYMRLFDVADSAMALVSEKLQAKMTKEPDVEFWPVLLGRCFSNQGDCDEVRRWYRKAIEMSGDSAYSIEIERCGCRLWIGDDGALQGYSVEFVENNYDCACLYSLMGMQYEALCYLKFALKGGYHDKAQLRTDPDLDNIRHSAEFQALLEAFGLSD